MAYYELLGFSDHPFAQTNADEEPFLDRYFVPPPFFDGVVGDPKKAAAAVVLAPRGAGKSAQRRQIELWAEKNGVLAVTYDRFEFGVGQKIADVSLAYHLRNIIIRTLLTYLSYLERYSDLLIKLEKHEKRDLSIFVHTYLGGLTGGSLQDLLRELKSLPEKIREFWSKNVGFLESLVSVLLKKFGLESIDLPTLEQEKKKLSETYKHQLEVLLALVNKIGFSSIYILVDKVDETEKTGNSSEASYTLIQPILQDLELLSMKGFGFKFFLWDAVLPYFQKDARPDRVLQHRLHWGRSALQRVLSRRLLAFSESKIDKFSSLLEDGVGFNIDEAIALIADGSPRNVIRICEKILSAQADLDAGSKRISMEAVERGIKAYCDQVVEERYGTDVIRDLMRVGRELFTINYLVNSVFKIAHENTSRNRVNTWTSSGLVKQIGTVLPEDGRKPLNWYYVRDPAMTRVIHKNVPLGKFLADRWMVCSHCEHDVLMDVNLYPRGNDPLCPDCGRGLI